MQPTPDKTLEHLPEELVSDDALAKDLLSLFVTHSNQAVLIGERRENGGHRILFSNEVFRQITGFAAPDLDQAEMETFMAPREKVSDWVDLADKLASGQVFDRILPAKKRDGRTFWASLHGYPLRFRARAVSHWLLAFEDITPRQEPFLELRQSEELYRLIAENSRDIVTVHRFDGICTYASPSCLEMLGFTPEEMMHRPIESLFHPDDCLLARSVIERHFNARHKSTFTHRLLRKDGTFIWCETTSKSSWDIQGDQPGGFIAVTRDISKRHKLEDELKTIHMLMSAVFESAPYGICITDRDGIIHQHNQAFTATFDPSCPDLRGKFLSEIFPLGSLSEGTQGTEIRRADGSFITAHLNVRKLSLSDELHTLITLVDRTEQLAVDAKLRDARSLESLGTLAGGIAHDFNNLLAIILGYASLLRQAAPDNQRIADYGDIIMDAGRRGADVVRQLMLFANQHDPLISCEDIHSVLGDVLVRGASDWPEDIKLECNFSSSDSVLMIDQDQVGRAIEHLLKNAREAIKGPGLVKLRTADRELCSDHDGSRSRWLEITVSDTGCGMSELTKARMFDPFFAYKKGPEVRGLGLAIVYGVVKAHRGKIEVVSQLGKGTQITILLPHENAAQSSNAVPPAKQESSKSDACILVVEDEVDIGKLWHAFLQKQGWTVYWAKDGDEALRIYSEHRDSIDLLFSDVGLPGDLDGWELCSRIRTERPNIPIILASGYFKRNVQNTPSLAEPILYVDKPYQPPEVLDKMRSLLCHT